MASKHVFDGVNIALLPAFQFLHELSRDAERVDQHEHLKGRLQQAADLLHAEFPDLAVAIRYGVAVCEVSGLLDGFASAPATVSVNTQASAMTELQKVRASARAAFGHLIPHALAALRMAAENPSRVSASRVARFDTIARADGAEGGFLSYADTRKDIIRAAAMAESVEPHIADYLRLRVEEFDEIARETEQRKLRPR